MLAIGPSWHGTGPIPPACLEVNPLGGGDSAQLRRWTAIVLLVLLIFVTVAPFFNPGFRTEPAFFGLVGGMVTGLFVAEAVSLLRKRNGHDG